MAKRTGAAVGYSARAVRTARPAEGRDEWEAAWIVSECLGGIPRRRSGPGHDYDIEVGLHHVALEVTKSAPFANSDLAMADAAYEQEDDAAPASEARATAAGR